jgi:hypothetical protein
MAIALKPAREHSYRLSVYQRRANDFYPTPSEGVLVMIAVQPAPANSNAYFRCSGSEASIGWLVM